MPKSMTSEQKELGAAVIARLAEQKPLPAQLKSFVKAFTDEQRALEAAARKTEDARATRDEALAQVAKADAALDDAVAALANRIVGADLGPRKNPFEPFGGAAPADV